MKQVTGTRGFSVGTTNRDCKPSHEGKGERQHRQAPALLQACLIDKIRFSPSNKKAWVDGAAGDFRGGRNSWFGMVSAMSRPCKLLDLRAVSFAAMAFIALLTGCGPGSGRLPVSGEVKLDGVPLDEGAIRLTSSGSEKLSASGALIQNGEFYIPEEKGLPPGTYVVEISSPDTSVPPVVYQGAPGQPALPPTAPERIPREYNVGSKHTVEVTTDSDNHFVFEITSRRGN